MFFMNRLLVLMCMIFAALGSATSHAEQKLQAAKSDIVFVSKQMGVPVEGHFKSFDAQISFDPAKPASGKISFSVDMASASGGYVKNSRRSSSGRDRRGQGAGAAAGCHGRSRPRQRGR